MRLNAYKKVLANAYNLPTTVEGADYFKDLKVDLNPRSYAVNAILTKARLDTGALFTSEFVELLKFNKKIEKQLDELPPIEKQLDELPPIEKQLDELPPAGDDSYSKFADLMTQDRLKKTKIICPFCEDYDFDLCGLKIHLVRGHCEAFEKQPGFKLTEKP